MTTTETFACEASWDNCDQPHYCARPMDHRGNHECECGEEIAPCGARYPGSGRPGARIVACDLAAGHDGEHEELATESTWPRREPAAADGRSEIERLRARVADLETTLAATRRQLTDEARSIMRDPTHPPVAADIAWQLRQIAALPETAEGETA